MRKLVNQAIKMYLDWQYSRTAYTRIHPARTQEELWRSLRYAAGQTKWGQQYDYKSMRSFKDFAAQVPLQDYGSLKPYIERMMLGEKDVLWPGQVKWFSKSSGTTSDKSKIIPVTSVNLRKTHIGGSWQTMMWFYHNRKDARQFELKSLIMGGSLSSFPPYPKTKIGDISAIMTFNMPLIGHPFFTPDFKTAIMSDYEAKLERMAQICGYEERMATIGGVPTWLILLIRRIMDIRGVDHMLDVWPNFQGYIHGGVSFEPYREQFKQFFPSEKVSYQEVYNASEGYFAVQHDFQNSGMLLLTDNGVFYEFIASEHWGQENPPTLILGEVEEGKNYAMVISTNAGLWRYKLGDTVKFLSTQPPVIKITGRTRQFVNAFGEEVMVENTDQAIAAVSIMYEARVVEYTVAPVYFNDERKAGHEWLVEFDKEPDDLDAFAESLDLKLQSLNSDYEAKRQKDLALTRLRLKVLPRGTFYKWLNSKGRIGGQNKVPRLANHRKYINEILQFSENI